VWPIHKHDHKDRSSPIVSVAGNMMHLSFSRSMQLLCDRIHFPNQYVLLRGAYSVRSASWHCRSAARPSLWHRRRPTNLHGLRGAWHVLLNRHLAADSQRIKRYEHARTVHGNRGDILGLASVFIPRLESRQREARCRFPSSPHRESNFRSPGPCYGATPG